MQENIALVAHDNKKKDLIEWCDFNKGILSRYTLFATGGSGKKIIEKHLWKLSCLRMVDMVETWNWSYDC